VLWVMGYEFIRMYNIMRNVIFLFSSCSINDLNNRVMSEAILLIQLERPVLTDFNLYANNS